MNMFFHGMTDSCAKSPHFLSVRKRLCKMPLSGMRGGQVSYTLGHIKTAVNGGTQFDQ